MMVAMAAPNSSQSTAGGMPSHHRSTYRGGMTSTAAFTRTPSPRELRTDVIIALVVFLGAVISAGLSIIAQVYGDEQSAARQFERFRRCRDIYTRLWSRGKTVQQLTVCA